MLPEPEFLGKYFHKLFQLPAVPNKRKADWKKGQKSKAKEKRRAKADANAEVALNPPPDVQLPGNPSSLAVFASVRLAVLERWRRQTSQALLAPGLPGEEPEIDSDDDTFQNDDSVLKVPKLVGVGLCTVFELIRESRHLHPLLCTKALRALLDVLQGQQPEGLKGEPPDVIEPLFDLLLDLATSHGPESAAANDGSHLTAVACACLMALVVVRGDTGKLLSATAALLMSPRALASQNIHMPEVLAALQRSVQSVLLGRATRPDWVTHGVQRTSRIDTFHIKLPISHDGSTSLQPGSHTLASDGQYLYLFDNGVLYKLGSGYGGTIKGHLYTQKPDFSPHSRGWLGFAGNKLYFRAMGEGTRGLSIVDREALTITFCPDLPDPGTWGPGALFSDGDNLGAITSAKDDGFCVRSVTGPGSEVLCLKLARKCVEAFGNTGAAGEEGTAAEGSLGVTVLTGSDDDTATVMAGKDFALIRTTGGKVLYSGKGVSLGVKQTAGGSGLARWSRWNELPVTKSPRVSMIATGHEGLHAVLVTDDGNVFFTGTARRGEDGDQSKARRQPKPVKPKKVVRVEGQSIVHAACNNGSTALVSREGQLLMFGKDTAHCDAAGLVTGLREVEVRRVALGKAHAVVLTSKGHVYTFGINNKGQCGRDFSVAVREAPAAVVAMETAGEEGDEAEGEWEETPEGMCAPGRHRWRQDKCMICTVCRECTGYSISCLSSMRPDRNPGQACGCGAGDSGCAVCGCCRICARESVDNSEVAILGPSGAGDLGGMVRLDLIFGGRHSRLQDQLQRRLEERRQRLQRGAKLPGPRLKVKTAITPCRPSNSAGGGAPKPGPSRVEIPPLAAGIAAVLMGEEPAGSDVERDASRVTSLAPARVILPSESPAVEVACGLHHTLVLLQSGEVYAFGSNACGQLGVGDIAAHAGPVLCRVPGQVVQVAAGSNHSVLLTAKGEVYTAGSFQKNQLGRVPNPVDDSHGAVGGSGGATRKPGSSRIAGEGPWHAVPGCIPGVGPHLGRRASWVGASGDLSFVKLDESLINAASLSTSTLLANRSAVLILPTESETGGICSSSSGSSQFRCLVINKSDGSCSSFGGRAQADFAMCAAALDPLYNILWSYHRLTGELSCHNPIAAETTPLPALLAPELALPVTAGCYVTRTQAALHVLGCVDSLAGCSGMPRPGDVTDGVTVPRPLSTPLLPSSPQASMPAVSASHRAKVYSSEDFSAVNRFESYGGGWGYSGHSIEAIRFMADTDLLVGGFGLFGGRGEYTGKIKLYDIGMEGGEQEIDGELLAETEDVPFECAPRQKYPMLFDEPVPVQANRWYVAWARVGGPSSDCGSSGQGMVTTEDSVVFCFKSSRRANNGSDVNGGQIPQILYRVVVPESQAPSRQLDTLEPVYHLSKTFSKSVSKECFESLIALLQWSWNTFKAGLVDVTHLTGTQNQIAVLDLERLVFISRACLRLLKTYTNELYPNEAVTKKSPTESSQLASCIGDVRSLLRQILSDSLPNSKKSGKGKKRDTGAYLKMITEVLQEAHETFVACFHAFYPTASLRWCSLCHLLGEMERLGPSANLDRLLSAVLASLCHPAVKLRSTFPILGVLEHTSLLTAQLTNQSSRPPPSYSSSSSPDSSSASTSSASSSTTANHTQAIAGPSQPISPDTNGALPMTRGSPESHHYPLLVEHMIYRAQIEEGLGSSSWQFKDILERLLDIVTLPVSQALCRDKVSHSAELTHHCCHLIARVIAELASQSSGSDEELEGACGRVLHISPSRFTRCNQCRTWNTGNGSPDAICFSVDRPGVAIVGVCVYGGIGTYEYELELLDDQNSGGNDPSHSQRWNSLEICRGTFTPDDCIGDVAELKFEKPVPIREHIKYAIRLRNHGGRTSNGDGGLNSVRGPDGTLFTFSTCSLSFNGTTQTRGQIPQILYYSSPQDSESQQTSRALAEMQARKCTLSLAGAVIKRSAALLALAKPDEFASQDILGNANVITTLLPLVLAHISPVATSDPRSAVQVLGLIQDLLPNVSQLNLAAATMMKSTGSLDSQDFSNTSIVNGLTTTSLHHAYVESDHPYKPATVSNYKVSFPESVKWMTIEFDPNCGTAQPEDSLQLYIPALNLPPGFVSRVDDDDQALSPFWPVLHKFSGTNNWPQMAVVLPGNEVTFSLETASDYVQDERASNFGFRCLVVGYEWPSLPGDGLRHLECELAFLGGMCAAALMKKDLQLPPASVEEVDEDIEAVEEVAQQVYQQNAALLGKGFALASPPSIHQALEGVLPFSYQSIERQFLRDLVSSAPGTSGGRLARWLQPESYVEPRRCEVLYSRDDMRCGWPAIVTLLSKDQYGQLVHAPNLRIEVKAVPIDKGDVQGEAANNSDAQQNTRKSRRISEPDALTFGGHPQPTLEVPYEVTLRDKMCYHAISIMKAYENYSFEELRLSSPAVRRSSENMLVRPNGDGSYSATWTPASTGWYCVLVTVDGYSLDEVYKVEVKEPPQGLAPPVPTVVRRTALQPSRLRKFVAKYSAGLRIRAHPSLQSEQIGVVSVNGVISFVDEIHNDDGVWLRLSGDSLRQLCSTGHPEAWCLQYNQHLGKTLLLPVEEPKSILDEVIRETILRNKNPPESATTNGPVHRDGRLGGGPGMYQVVKCGASGHNIRSRPTLTAPPVGMLVLGNHVMVMDDLVNSEGTWVQLDTESRKEFCFNSDGEAWSLAASRSDVVYLQNEGDPDRDVRGDRSADAFTHRRGFDFATRPTPPFPTEPSASSFHFGPGAASIAPVTQEPTPFVFGSSQPEARGRPDKPEIAPKPAMVNVTKLSALHKWLKERNEEGGGGATSPPIVERRTSAPPSCPPPVPGRDLPPELQGVSVKELVKAIGESRANGNGVTPPGTPRRPSRSSSPKAPSVVMLAQGSRSSSPVPIPPGKLGGVQESAGSSPERVCGSPRSIGLSPLVSGTGQGAMVTGDSGRRGSTQSDTSALVSSLTRDLSHSPSNSSLQMRSDSPHSLIGQEAVVTTVPSSSPRLTQTGTQTSPEGSLNLRGALHFSVGEGVSPSTAGSTAVRISPKLGRKDRSGSKGQGGSAQLRSKRDRPHSPKDHQRSASGRHHTRGTSPATPISLAGGKETVKEAITPSVAECLRAVFAAFLWHEGLVHDAMACASFLKFHPGLPKQGALVITRQQPGMQPGAGVSAADKIRQRHSVEVSASNYLHIQPSTLETLMMSAANANANRTRGAVKKHEGSPQPQQGGPIKEEEGMAQSATSTELPTMHTVTVLPPALRSLVLLWEELSAGCLRAIHGQVLLLPSPALLLGPRPPSSSRRPESGGSRPPSAAAAAAPTPMVQVKERDRERRGRKKKEWKPMGRGAAMFGDPWYMVMRGPTSSGGAGAQSAGRGGERGSGDRETACELCGGCFPHPVTFHMRSMHPGCGETAGGKGYNSGGNFCVGWAGNCGDGGVGGSTWYLICDSCRERYLRQRKQLGKDAGSGGAGPSGSGGGKKAKKKSSTASLAPSTPASKLLSPMMQQLDTHVVMKNNAMFLLELASAASRDPPPSSPPLRRSPHTPAPAGSVSGGMPSLAEQGYEEGPFPSLSPGVPGFQCLATLGVQPAQVRQLSEEHLLAETLRQNGEQGLERFLEGMDSRPTDSTPDSILSDSDDGIRGGRPFHRSISMGTSGRPEWCNARANSVVVMRKRNNSSGENVAEAAGSSSLLCHPSAALQRLVPTELSCTVSTDENMPRPVADLMDRPVIGFILQHHNLESLQLAMRQAIRKSACRVYAMQALTWLLRSVTQPTGLHDLLWWFVAALTPSSCNVHDYQVPAAPHDPTDNEGRQEGRGIGGGGQRSGDGGAECELRPPACEHPLSDLGVGGEAVRPLPSAFHALLQAVADLMLLLPAGSALQTMAVRCWGIRFSHADHAFLHRSHVFSNISKILSRSEEEDAIDESHHSALSASLATAGTAPPGCLVEALRDLTPGTDIKASSRQAMVGSLTDTSTETFWESSDEDRNKTKFITLTCPAHTSPRIVYVHIDNCRDLANKVSSVAFQSGPNTEELYKLNQLEVEARYSGWLSCPILESRHCVVRLELRGPDNSLRLRQVRVLGEVEGESLRAGRQHSASTVQQRNCEAETLRVFRLITSQVFGKLIVGGGGEEEIQSASGPEPAPPEVQEQGAAEDSNDLREHVVGILFSRSKLTHLQRQVCSHIVQAIRKEALRVREEWEGLLCSAPTPAVPATQEGKSSDTYCFEMLSMVLALSGSSVGRAYLAQQYGLLRDLLSLLHTGSARVQRQVTLLLRRMLPEVQPATLALMLGVERLPPPDFSIVAAASKGSAAEPPFDMHRAGILDVFLSVIAKALTLQVRVKGTRGTETSGQNKMATTASLATSVHPRAPLGQRWWLRGCIARRLADGIISLLKDMAAGKLGEAWAEVTKGAVAENILNLTRLPEASRAPSECLAAPALWLALASLCVLDAEHVERLSSGQWSQADGQPAPPRPTCSNHDDGETAAIIQCNVCGSLCAECDRVLHLHRRTRLHHRQVCKEEEEAIKVDLHEGCGRTKLFWLLALADSSTLKALVEFRDRGTRTKPPGTVSAGVCRFCGATGTSGLLAIGNVCADQECQEHARNACSRLHSCGHMCGGIQGESPCLPCLHGCSRDSSLKQDADDMCMICFTDALSCAPAIQLKCGHVFHLHCCRNALSKRWAGPRITFAFSQCPICKSDMQHSELNALLAPIRELFEDVRRKALMRLEYEGLHRSEAIVSPGARFHNDAPSYAMDRYAYYVCFRCKKAYYGGEARCDADAGATEDYDPAELVCGACSDVSRAQMCPKHGTDFLEYKCRYCCSVAVFFCFGTTHFCNPCHDDFQRVTNLPRHELPRCPAGPRAKQLEGEECPLHIKHPPTGEEFALGCGVCRNAHTF